MGGAERIERAGRFFRCGMVAAIAGHDPGSSIAGSQRLRPEVPINSRREAEGDPSSRAAA